MAPEENKTPAAWLVSLASKDQEGENQGSQRPVTAHSGWQGACLRSLDWEVGASLALHPLETVEKNVITFTLWWGG